LVAGLLGCWGFFLGIYLNAPSGLQRFEADDERLVFGCLGALFTLLTLLPFDYNEDEDVHSKGAEWNWVRIQHVLLRVFGVMAGSFNLYNASAMVTEKTSGTPLETMRTFDGAKYAGPALASATYLLCVSPAPKATRVLAVTVPITILLVTLILHPAYIDASAADSTRATTAAAGAIVAVVGAMYTMVFLFTGFFPDALVASAQVLDMVNTSLAAAFGWFYWVESWTESLDPDATEWSIPVGAALGLTAARYLFHFILDRQRIAKPVAHEEDAVTSALAESGPFSASP
jgi:hypothetical protein